MPASRYLWFVIDGVMLAILVAHIITAARTGELVLDSAIKILGLLLPFGWLLTRWSVLAIRVTKRRITQEPGSTINKVHYAFTWMIVCVMSIIFVALLVFLLGV